MLYQDINAIVAKLDVGFTAAETHGMAAGMLCVNRHTETAFWLSEIQQGGAEFNSDDRVNLEALFEDTKSELLSDDFNFELFLPDNQAPFIQQTEALKNWCQGFLYGVSFAPTKNWLDEIRDVVKDITEITKLEQLTEEEDSENDFMEIIEYLRAAVMFLYSEFNSTDGRAIH